jgi:hypothetical protein
MQVTLRNYLRFLSVEYFDPQLTTMPGPADMSYLSHHQLVPVPSRSMESMKNVGFPFLQPQLPGVKFLDASAPRAEAAPFGLLLFSGPQESFAGACIPELQASCLQCACGTSTVDPVKSEHSPALGIRLAPRGSKKGKSLIPVRRVTSKAQQEILDRFYSHTQFPTDAELEQLSQVVSQYAPPRSKQQLRKYFDNRRNRRGSTSSSSPTMGAGSLQSMH